MLPHSNPETSPHFSPFLPNHFEPFEWGFECSLWGAPFQSFGCSVWACVSDGGQVTLSDSGCSHRLQFGCDHYRGRLPTARCSQGRHTLYAPPLLSNASLLGNIYYLYIWLIFTKQERDGVIFQQEVDFFLSEPICSHRGWRSGDGKHGNQPPLWLILFFLFPSKDGSNAVLCSFGCQGGCEQRLPLLNFFLKRVRVLLACSAACFGRRGSDGPRPRSAGSTAQNIYSPPKTLPLSFPKSAFSLFQSFDNPPPGYDNCQTLQVAIGCASNARRTEVISPMPCGVSGGWDSRRKVVFFWRRI